jgi:hypothetical protein
MNSAGADNSPIARPVVRRSSRQTGLHIANADALGEAHLPTGRTFAGGTAAIGQAAFRRSIPSRLSAVVTVSGRCDRESDNMRNYAYILI